MTQAQRDDESKTRTPVWAYVTDKEKTKLERAADKQRQTLSSFMAKSGLDKAKEVLDDDAE